MQASLCVRGWAMWYNVIIIVSHVVPVHSSNLGSIELCDEYLFPIMLHGFSPSVVNERIFFMDVWDKWDF